MRLAGKRALITGAGGGIGRTSARLFAREGAALAAVDIDLETARETATLIEREGGAAVAIHADVTDPDSVAEMIAQAETALGGLDVLFNNAGILLADDQGPVATPLASWEKTLAANLTGVFLCCKYGLPALLRASGGSIVNTASMVALLGSAVPQIAYTASKGGVIALSREIAVEYARRNIRVNALCPGPIETPLVKQLFDTPEKLERRREHMPQGRFGQAHEIAAVALFLASDDASYVTGATYTVDGGITAAYITPR